MAITITDYTEGTVSGNGVFDAMMVSVKAHLTEEYNKSRIRGPEYSTVYLGAVTQVMALALDFLLKKDLADLEAQKIQVEVEKLELEKTLVAQQAANAILEGEVLKGQKCKLDAEFDVLQETKLKTAAETALLAQKHVTEQAQTQGIGVDAASVIGKQILLYEAQTEGFKRDAEQKAAKMMIDTFNVRRTTDEATVADGVNLLSDANIGRAVGKLLAGINA